jgi:predicted XRE-type DNA-binding protein
MSGRRGSRSSGTFRGMYYVGKALMYALHFFRKKSKHGIATPKKNSTSSAGGSLGRATMKEKADKVTTGVVTASAWDGEPDQEEVEAQSFLALEILRRIEALGISQRTAAERLGAAQADISKMVNFKVWGFSLPRLSQVLRARVASVLDQKPIVPRVPEGRRQS